MCYYVSTSSDSSGLSWQAAASACQSKAGFSHQATLASIHHNAENLYIYNRLLANGRTEAWIGLNKKGSGTYESLGAFALVVGVYVLNIIIIIIII